MHSLRLSYHSPYSISHPWIVCNSWTITSKILYILKFLSKQFRKFPFLTKKYRVFFSLVFCLIVAVYSAAFLIPQTLSSSLCQFLIIFYVQPSPPEMKFNVITFYLLFFFAIVIKINIISFLLIILKYGLLLLSKMLLSKCQWLQYPYNWYLLWSPKLCQKYRNSNIKSTKLINNIS